nr:zinc ABC transporter substrate-binding protein [Pseudonocardia sp. C8]
MAALTLGVSACGSGQTQAPSTPAPPQVPVVASTDAWGSVARAVGGNFVQVQSIIDSPSGDPHGYEATPQDSTKVRDAKLVVMNGGGYDAFMTGLVQASGNRAPVIDAVASSGIEGAAGSAPAAAPPAAAGHNEAGHNEAGHGEAGHGAEDPHAAHGGAPEGEAGHEGHDHGSFNEHVWYSPPAVQKVADAVAQQLATIDPAHADYYRTNAQTVRGGIQQLTSKATDIGRTHPGARVAATEPVANHLLEAAGVHNVTPREFSVAVEEGTDPPAAVVARMLDLFRTRPPVDALIVNSQTSSPGTDQVRAAAEQAGVPVIEMSETLPDGTTDYVQWMNANLDALGGALNR